ncbi:MFS transporter [Amnibacterium kyonggiense]|uniref:Putative MFS family arabinose efflux permease n=1 Tax=Amnibacterium kyonggiense TaxID=595671 RepID=A0A4R7FRN8_9MICO|nr:MFS transporter [Amnibacterium kyonggiense]TDS80480.1 putative MFS family arabinose efflux permease [Amnibacterium kyonggiense]
MDETVAARPQVAGVATTLLATSLLGRLPQAMSALALVRIVVDGGGGYAFAGALTGGYVIASTAGTPLLGRLVDRSRRPRAVLLGSAAVATAALLGVAALVAVAPAAAFVCSLVAGFAFPPLEPTLRSAWPRIMAPGRQLARAFSADAAAQEVLFILGPLLAVGFAAWLGAAGAVVVMAVAGLAGTALFCLHRVLPSPAAAEPATGPHPSALRTRVVRTLVVVQIAAGLPIGVLTISAARLATLGGTASLNGWALAINAGGALVGALLIARFPLRTPPERALRFVLLLLAVLYLPTAAFGLPPALWLVGAFLAGILLPPLLTQVFAITAAATPATALTEANGWAISAFSVGIGAGTAIAGALAGAAGTGGAMAAVLGASVLAAAGAAFAAPARLR